MKFKLALLLLLFAFTINYAQTENPKITIESNDKIIYLDSMRNNTSAKNHEFYRIIKDYTLDKNSYIVYEFSKSGILNMQGTSKTKEGYSLNGERIYFHENGNKKSSTNYVKGRKNGIDVQWYENGNKKLEGEYIEDEKKRTSQQKINQFWDINGTHKVIDGNGFYDDQNGDEYAKGELKNGFKDGVWEGASTKPNYSYKETYQDGKLISGISTDKNGKNYNYNEVEISPNPKNGIADFYKFIAKNYRAPNVKGLKGKVNLTFVIDKTGKIMEPRVIKDLGYGTGEEALRIIVQYDGFAPGEQRGQKVRYSYSLPITIHTAD